MMAMCDLKGFAAHLYSIERLLVCGFCGFNEEDKQAIKRFICIPCWFGAYKHVHVKKRRFKLPDESRKKICPDYADMLRTLMSFRRCV